MQRTHDELKELIAPFALGAVPPDEEADVRAHLRSCPECRGALGEFEDVTRSLAMSVDPVEPPAGFLERTMERVAAEPGRAATPRLRRRWAPAWALGTAALAIACAVLVAGLVSTASTVDSQRQAVAALLEDPVLRLQGDDATAAVVEVDGQPVLVAGEMSTPPEGKVYQLWRMSPGCDPANDGKCSALSGGVIETGEAGAVTEVEGALGDYEEAAITLEDEEVDQPTGDPVMASFEI